MPLLEQSLGGLVIDLADEDPVDVDEALVHARRHPHLQIVIEGVVVNRAFVGRVHLRVRAVHRPAIAAFCVVAAIGAPPRDR